MSALVTLDDIRAAAERIRDGAVRTPLLLAGGPPLYLKCENFQPMGAFKLRGALNMIAQLSPDALAAGVITYSSGNHGNALALAAQRLGTRAVVVMPETAPQVKVDGVRDYGAEVIFEGTTSLQRKARAESELRARGLTMVPPFDHPWIIAGAGTVGLEILEQCPALTSVYVPMGGGGLIAGVAVAIKALRPEVRVIGVEPAGAPKMSTALAAGHPVTLEQTASIADGLLAVRAGELTFAHVRALVDDVVTVDENAIRGAIKWLFRTARIVAEPSGATSVAGALHAAAQTSGTVAIVSGGNVSPADYVGYLKEA